MKYSAMVVNKMTKQTIFARPDLDNDELTELIMGHGVYDRKETADIITALTHTKVLRFPSLGYQGVWFKIVVTDKE